MITMVRFLTASEVLMIYEDQIRRYGGAYGVRDLSLLSSALSLPQSSFDGTYLHRTIPDMAAAYAYHLCQNHPFIDGNKRVALASALVFLDINGYECTGTEDEVYCAMMAVARSEMTKTDFTRWFTQYSRQI
jgi:death-on-curing protein